jgi:hypothetical protein
MNKSPNKDITEQFPWRGKFMTRTEIDEYFNGDKVQCLLCGKKFKALPRHLERTHDITADDYREQYGLPWGKALCGAETSQKLSKTMFHRRKQGFRPPLEKAWENAWKINRRPNQPYHVKANIDNIRPIIEKQKKYEDQDYKNVLAKMLKKKMCMSEACNDPKLPHFRAVSKYAKRNPEFRKQLDQTYAQLPYSVQAGAGKLPEKKLLEDLLILKRSGLTTADISRMLGVSRSTINRRLKAAQTKN